MTDAEREAFSAELIAKSSELRRVQIEIKSLVARWEAAEQKDELEEEFRVKAETLPTECPHVHGMASAHVLASKGCWETFVLINNPYWDTEELGPAPPMAPESVHTTGMNPREALDRAFAELSASRAAFAQARVDREIEVKEAELAVSSLAPTTSRERSRN